MSGEPGLPTSFEDQVTLEERIVHIVQAVEAQAQAMREKAAASGRVRQMGHARTQGSVARALDAVALSLRAALRDA